MVWCAKPELEQLHDIVSNSIVYRVFEWATHRLVADLAVEKVVAMVDVLAAGLVGESVVV